MSFNKPSMNGLNHFSIQEVNEDITNLETTKQNLLTAGSNITISGDEISATDTNTNTEYTAGSNIAISASNEISSTDTDTTYTASSTGGLALSGTEFSLDLSTLTTTQTLPQGLEIISNTDTQLLITATQQSSQDARIDIRGRRTSSTTDNHAEVRFQNYDNDITTTKILGSIVGRVSNATDNTGGLLFNNYSDGATQSTSMNISSQGNITIGDDDTFQDNYKLLNNGTSKFTGLNYIRPNLLLLAYDKDDVFGTDLTSNWGNGSTQISLVSLSEVGDSFSSVSSGKITLSKNGFYRIRVSAQTQSDGYNDRISFMNYLTIVTGGTTTDYDQDESKNFFGWGYIRNNSDGGHQSVSFEDYIYLTSGSTIQPRHKLETGSNRNFDNTLTNTQVDNYLNIHVERIYDTTL